MRGTHSFSIFLHSWHQILSVVRCCRYTRICGGIMPLRVSSPSLLKIQTSSLQPVATAVLRKSRNLSFWILSSKMVVRVKYWRFCRKQSVFESDLIIKKDDAFGEGTSFSTQLRLHCKKYPASSKNGRSIYIWLSGTICIEIYNDGKSALGRVCVDICALTFIQSQYWLVTSSSNTVTASYWGSNYMMNGKMSYGGTYYNTSVGSVLQ